MTLLLLLTEKLTVDVESSIRDFLGENSSGFWHRLPNAWFIMTADEIGPFELREKIEDVLPHGAQMMILAVDPTELAYSMRPALHEWFVRHWDLVPEDDEDVEKTAELVR